MRRLSLLLVFLLAGCPNPSGAPDAPLVEPEARLSAGTGAQAIAEAMSTLYVAGADGGVTAIDTDQGQVLRRLEAPGLHADDLVAFSDQREVLAVDHAQNRLWAIAPFDDHAVKSLGVLPATVGPLAVASDDRLVVAASPAKPALYKLEFTAGHDLIASTAIPLEAAATDAFDYAAGWAVVGHETGATAVKITSRDTQSVGQGQPGGPVALGLVEGVPTLALLAHPGGLTLHDLRTNTESELVNLGEGAADIHVVPLLSRAFIAMRDSNELAVVALTNRTRLARIRVADKPVKIFEAPLLATSPYRVLHAGQGGELWVDHEGSDTMSVVDGQWLLVEARVKAGPGPHRVAFAGTKAYVANSDGTVAVVDRAKLPGTFKGI